MREEFAPSYEILKPTTATIGGLFSFSSLLGRVDKMMDIFLPTLSSLGARREATTSLSSNSSLGLPRIVVAGVKLTSYSLQMREKLKGIKTFSLFEV
eukprot:Gb_04561 [translate_table: standard]